MKTTNDMEEAIKKNLNFAASAEMRERILTDVMNAQEESKKTKSALAGPNIRSIIMKNPITKFAAAAVVIIAVIIGTHQFGGSIDVASVTFADVLKNIRNSKTLTFMVRAKEQEPPIMKVMVIDPYVSRFEFLGEQMPSAPIIGGQIWIIDTDKGKALILNTVKKTGKVYPARREFLDIYDTFRNFRDRVDFSVEEIGSRQIGDKQAIGFKLKKENKNQEITVWADPKTKLPILMEETYENAEGQIMQHFVTDIVFDAELDKSLFILRPPEGYKAEEFEYDLRVNRLKSAVNMDRIIKACRKYVNEHNGQWPDSLQELTIYGLDKDVFTNPGQPAREVGYVYLKPPTSPSESRIVLYEAHNVWDGGINVGFANYHIEFIKEESDFKNRLGENGQQRQ